jgi:hypothetical protein
METSQRSIQAQNGGAATPDAPEREWACNRCMYSWDGNGGHCPSCGEQATHGRAFKQNSDSPRNNIWAVVQDGGDVAIARIVKADGGAAISEFIAYDEAIKIVSAHNVTCAEQNT